MLKSLRFIPLCVLILSGYAFSEDSGNSSSDSDAAKRSAVDSGIIDSLRDLKSGINGVNKPNFGSNSSKSSSGSDAANRGVSAKAASVAASDKALTVE
ncbi:hypothetical protein NOF79_004077 [Salmonella enterica]|nr:hypothetical protein [Salmonella enterica]